jgi:hypothetical protein
MPGTGASVTWKVRDAAEVPRAATVTFAVGSNAGFEELAERVRLLPGVSTSLTVTVASVEAPIGTVADPGDRETCGASFTGVTVSVNVREADSAPSLTVTVIDAVPD